MSDDAICVPSQEYSDGLGGMCVTQDRHSAWDGEISSARKKGALQEGMYQFTPMTPEREVSGSGGGQSQSPGAQRWGPGSVSRRVGGSRGVDAAQTSHKISASYSMPTASQ